MPAAIPDTRPLEDPTVATDVLLLVHAPPVTALLNKVVDPTQTLAVPLIVPGEEITETMVVARHPETTYEIVEVPVVTPVTQPVEITDAFAGAEELHAPPVVALVRQVTPLMQTVVSPVIGATPVVTVTVVPAEQPEAMV